jgi:hypothetical protein
MGKFEKRWFGPFKVQYCLPNIVILVSVNNVEPNPILINVNKLKPYTYVDQTLKGIQSLVDQTLKGIQSLVDQKSLQSIHENHIEETFNEDLENQIETKTIKIN